jgi:hypothetical protein
MGSQACIASLEQRKAAKSNYQLELQEKARDAEKNQQLQAQQSAMQYSPLHGKTSGLPSVSTNVVSDQRRFPAMPVGAPQCGQEVGPPFNFSLLRTTMPIHTRGDTETTRGKM